MSCNKQDLNMIARELESFEKKSIERDSRRVSYSEQQTIINRMSPIDYNLCNFKGKEVLVIVEKEDIPEEIIEEIGNSNFVDDNIHEEVLYNCDLMIKNFDY